MDSDKYLVVHPGSPEAFRVELEDGKVLEIGRKPNPAPNSPKRLVLPVAEVSGTHAEIRPGGAAGWSIRDLGSTNGTRLNGEWISPGQEYGLKNGDVVKIAQVDLQVNLPNQNGGAARPMIVEDEHEKTQFHIKLINATILVGDIRSFTSLMEEYSAHPETVMQAAQRVFQTLGEQIKRQHGQVEKIAGDAIMAYWQGSDTLGVEQNLCASQACRTALQLRDIVKQIAAQPSGWPFPNFPLEVDVALATGPVAAGILGSAKANPALLGDTANLAFRLEKLIQNPGDIIMDGATYDLAKDGFNVEKMGPVTVKGRQRPVDIYKLLSIKA